MRLWEGKYREPDVLFVGGKHASRLTENYCKGADLVMEVVSDGEESHRLDRETKREEYAKARIPEYWIVDPEQARITVLTLDGRSYTRARRILARRPGGLEATSRVQRRCDLGHYRQAIIDASSHREGIGICISRSRLHRWRIGGVHHGRLGGFVGRPGVPIGAMARRAGSTGPGPCVEVRERAERFLRGPRPQPACGRPRVPEPGGSGCQPGRAIGGSHLQVGDRLGGVPDRQLGASAQEAGLAIVGGHFQDLVEPRQRLLGLIRVSWIAAMQRLASAWFGSHSSVRKNSARAASVRPMIWSTLPSEKCAWVRCGSISIAVSNRLRAASASPSWVSTRPRPIKAST